LEAILRPSCRDCLYLSLRGVIVPGGEHTVAFRYHPASLYFGAGLSLATLLAFFVYCGFALRGKFAS